MESPKGSTECHDYTAVTWALEDEAMSDVAAHGRAEEDRDVEPGTLLVAAPGLSDPNFRRTVVYVIEHRGEGTLGVVLNRPSDVSVQEVLPAWAPHTTRPKAVFVGGPVDAKTALCLAAFRPGHDPATIGGVVAVRGPVALVDLDSNPAELAPRLRGLRVFAGYSGWNSGQLAGEIGRGDWILVPALPDDVLASGSGDLWGRVLRRQGMPLALLSTFPADVAAN
jgi:putative transcriptional regulator